MKFKKQFMQDTVYGDGAETIQKTITSHSRWSVGHEIIFKHNNKYYQSYYSVGATENQDEAPYEYSDDEIECPEVFPVEETVVVYRTKDTKDAK